VAQRTGAKRLLAPLAKTTSAGLCLALVVAAALLLAGCGGGDSSTTAKGTSPDPAATQSPSHRQAQGQGGGGPTSSAAAKDGAGQGSDGAGQGGSADSGSSQAGSSAGAAEGQKHGPRIAQPKGPQEQAPSPKQVQEATVADMSLTSPAIVAGDGHLGRLAATYTCDGANTPPELHWSGVPAGTKELALFAISVQPFEEHLFIDWAVTGLDPGLEGIEAGQLPKGAVVGNNSFGEVLYSICPPREREAYMFAVYALPQKLGLKRGFDGLTARQEVLDVSGDVGLLPAVAEHG
jgi:phosphatidylethanolamine-binding protein (PEBP) family uncharacterized protein